MVQGACGRGITLIQTLKYSVYAVGSQRIVALDAIAFLRSVALLVFDAGADCFDAGEAFVMRAFARVATLAILS